MAEYTLADAVADRDEAYRLLQVLQARLDDLEVDQDTDDPAEPNEPLRCAVCLAAAIHDARIGTTSANGHLAVTVAEGTALCFRHFDRLDLATLWAVH